MTLFSHTFSSHSSKKATMTLFSHTFLSQNLSKSFDDTAIFSPIFLRKHKRFENSQIADFYNDTMHTYVQNAFLYGIISINFHLYDVNLKFRSI